MIPIDSTNNDISSFSRIIGLVAVVGAIACLIPSIIRSPNHHINLNDSDFSKAINSIEYKYSVVANIAVGIKILVDFFQSYITYEAICPTGSKSCVILVLSMILTNVFMLYSFDNLSLSLCLLSARSIVRICVVLIYLDSTNYLLRYRNSILIITYSYCFGIVFRTASYYSKVANGLFRFSVFCYILAIIGLLFILISHYRILKPIYRSTTNTHMSNNDSLNSFLVLIAFTFIMVTIAALKVYPLEDWSSTNKTTLVAISYLELVFVVFFSAIHKHVIDRQACSLKNSLETKRTFVRFVSHEIRTPLNTVSLGIDLLQSEIRKAGNFPELIEITKDLKSSGEIALTLVNDLLVYDKLEAGILKLELDHLPIWNVLLESIRPFQLQARQAEIELVLPSLPLSFATSCLLPYEIEDIIAIADKSRIRQVVSNLISNALKFSPKHNSVIIDITCTPWNDEADSTPLLLPQLEEDSISEEYKGCKKMKMMLSVIDQGPGLSLENQNKLFKEIIQFNPGKLQAGGGSGLGLWISQRIATMHGGKLSVMSEGEGFGSTFSFTLPVYIKQQQQHDIDDIIMNRSINFIERSSSNLSISSIMNQSHRIAPCYYSSPTNPRGNMNPALAPPTLLQRQDTSFSLHSTIDRNDLDNNDLYLTDDMHSAFEGLVVLVVDDVPMNRKMICRVLQGKCRGTLEAEDGIVAVNLIKQRILEAEAKKGEGQQGREGTGTRPIDVILMDYVMPIMNGPEATRLIRSLGYTGIIIGVTGNAQPAEVNEFLNAGANKILIKPVSLESLIMAIL